MKKKYLIPEAEIVQLNLTMDVLGPSTETFAPEETIKEDVVDIELD